MKRGKSLKDNSSTCNVYVRILQVMKAENRKEKISENFSQLFTNKYFVFTFDYLLCYE